MSIALDDCDGLALANRTLTLKATHGRFSPSTVKTDSSGHAHATFTATSQGIAQLTADYGPYETVNHKRDQRRGRAAITIQSSGVWEVHIQASYTQNNSGSTDGSTFDGSTSASLSAVELIKAAHPLSGGSDGGFDTLSGLAQASYSNSQTEIDTLPDVSTCVTTVAASGSTSASLPSFVVLGSGPGLSLKLDFGGIESNEHQTYHCAPYDDSPGDSTTAETFDVELQNNAGWDGSCTQSGNARHGYTVHCNDNTNQLTGDALGETGSQIGSLTITLTPL